MNLYHFFEECNLEKRQVTDNLIHQIHQEIPDGAVVSVATTWLVGIGNRHHVPGQVVATTAGICDFYRETGVLTQKQKIFLVANLIQYWDQIELETRTQIMI